MAVTVNLAVAVSRLVSLGVDDFTDQASLLERPPDHLVRPRRTTLRTATESVEPGGHFPEGQPVSRYQVGSEPESLCGLLVDYQLLASSAAIGGIFSPNPNGDWPPHQ